MTLAEVQSELLKYRAARDRILNAQEYGTGSVRTRRADLAVVERKINELEIKLAILNRAGRIKTTHAVFGGHRGR